MNKLDWDATLVMALAYTLIYGAMMMLILLVDIPEQNAKTTDLLAGAMTIIQTNIVQFFFGSTRSSKEKDETISTLSVPVAAAANAAAPQKAGNVQMDVAGNVTVDHEKK